MTKMEPYIISPTTGSIPDDKIVGRDREIELLKDWLKSQSVVLDEIRRMGKTLFLKKFAYLSVQNDEPNKAIYFIFQGTDSINSLTDVILNELRQKEKYGWLKVQMHRCSELYHKIRGDKASVKYQDIEFSFALPDFKVEWKKAFRACIEDLADHQLDKGERLTLIFDELPIMLWEWIRTGRSADAMAFLDLLRDLHFSIKNSDRIRFIFCGSIGMQVVLDKLKQEHQYTGEPFNHMQKFQLPPMEEADALFLCECLYLASFQCDHSASKSAYFEDITERCNRLPYFIHSIFHNLKHNAQGILSVQTINDAFEALLKEKSAATDVFEQLHQRLLIYYPQNSAKLMRSCLNLLSKAPASLSEQDIKTALSFDEDDVQAALNLLWRDDFLDRTFDEQENRMYAFRYSLIKRWWKLNKA